ncbi:hypothetical protein P3342_001015 [Pyrenophora teres f. teres]|uniref:Uncharacterized protein n=1 Tax=Pyrenophora teres f. teres TaxID=97479 RepID=A0A6S6VUT8_9PLEO|nr:hypothetical protein HRS9139_03997 [Pyrenophora teres f. teres]KAE8838126.1 hypothetical protein PTNB85_05461 [Pyrenophora teres f. teres]KAE8862954.1 hypothetical protein PTNB29_05516 [Pyrenophora teres f. teres]KAE8868813.1 hypothetical protein PTNB73_03866 [Pyrenophora teres f. teres]KAK1918886.1 hypothetical protein P3342_001015 [Pyrenophora teres f. teres]
MKESTYLNNGGIVRQSSADHTISRNFDLNTIGNAFQHPFRYHHLSPATEQRQDSMPHTSPQGTPPSSSAHDQLELQPCTTGQFKRRSHNDYSHRPMDNGMSRSRSHFSSTSSSQYSNYQSPRRASYGSFDGNPASGSSGMFRTYSNTSATQHTTVQPSALQQHMESGEPRSGRLADLSPNVEYGYTNRSAMDPFHFNVNDIIGGSDSRNDDHVRDFGETKYHDK